MAAPKGNQFWKARSKHGRDHEYQPDELWAEALAYFEWVEKHPLHTAELVKYKGSSRLRRVPVMRAMTEAGFCLHLGIGEETWRRYCHHEDFRGVCTRIKTVIRQQKFEGAAAGLLNHAIIARDLGLADKRELSGPDGAPIPVEAEELPPDELVRRLAFALERSQRGRTEGAGEGSDGQASPERDG